jgi:hypothetical protein
VPPLAGVATDRVREDDLAGSGHDESLRGSATARVDHTLERAANATLIVAVDGRSAIPDPLDAGRGLCQRSVAVALVEGFSGRKRHVYSVEGRRGGLPSRAR